jgi:RimJ/RimL family protein N-acetyltransferase
MRNPIMIGERVYLRAMEPEDGPVRAQIIAQETEDIFLAERYRAVVSPLAFEAEMKDAYKSFPPEDILFAVCLKDNDQYIGFVSLDGIDWVNRTAETGSWFGPPEVRGQGYGPEAKHLLLEYAFDHLQLHAIFATVWEPNVRSARAVTRQGYQPAGRLRFDDYKHGVYRDLLVFDLLREEWVAARERGRADLTPQPPLLRREGAGG